jgi:photosystem II stability/assembly factor-like uncharacterized protein
MSIGSTAIALLLIVAPLLAQATSGAARLAAWREHAAMARSSPFRDLAWRAVGPLQSGGRVEAIAVEAGRPSTIYVGVGSGNLWKSTDNGITWSPIFEHESTCAIGDVAVAASNPKVVWLGSGETQPRHSGYSYAGMGVFRSDDAGDTWQHLGLEDTHHIGKVLIDPKDPELVHVAAIGRFWMPNRERGVFRTRDGGRSWEKVLFIDEHTGAIDLAQHPRRREVLYAAMWQHGGGEGSKPGWRGGMRSGFHRSVDAGKSWQRVTTGLPQGPVGRMGLAVTAAAPDLVFAFVDDQSPGPDDRQPIVGATLYRSDDTGLTWRRANEASLFEVFGEYGWKFCDVHVSASDPELVFVLGNRAYRSHDGGRSFERVGESVARLHETRGEVLHLDHHDLWIDPKDPGHLLLGNDGGLFQSWSGGRTWLHHNNLPATSFYAVSVDLHVPFRIFGGTQDNAALLGPSAFDVGVAKGNDPWENVYLDPWTGGDSFDTLLDPTDERFVYYEHQHGDLLRMDLGGESVQSGGPATQHLRPRAPKGESAWRFGWHAPLTLSVHDPRTLYMGANRLLVTRDRGGNWSALGPELAEPAGSEWDRVPFGTITSIAESPLDKRLLYVGTEGGRVWRTTDGGTTWDRVDDALPDKWLNRVIASGHAVDRVYVALSGYREDDFASYVFVSDDRGGTWRSLAAGLPSETVHVVREDQTDPELLYLGTTYGVFVSVDRGSRWELLGSGLPTTPVHDLVVHPRDGMLVAGTHGRSVWVFDLRTLRERAAKPR